MVQLTNLKLRRKPAWGHQRVGSKAWSVWSQGLCFSLWSWADSKRREITMLSAASGLFGSSGHVYPQLWQEQKMVNTQEKCTWAELRAQRKAHSVGLCSLEAWISRPLVLREDTAPPWWQPRGSGLIGWPHFILCLDAWGLTSQVSCNSTDPSDWQQV